MYLHMVPCSTYIPISETHCTFQKCTS